MTNLKLNNIPAEFKSVRVEGDIATRKVFKAMGAGTYLFICGEPDDEGIKEKHEVYCDTADSFNNNYRFYSNFGITEIVKK